MAKITIKLFASLAKFKPPQVGEPSFEITIIPGKTVEQVILELGLPAAKISTFSVNKKIVKEDQQLYDGDFVIFFPTIAGG